MEIYEKLENELRAKLFPDIDARPEPAKTQVTAKDVEVDAVKNGREKRCR